MGCCGTRYYCANGQPVAVDPDENGRYDVPDGGTSGWYKTYAEALTGCPPAWGPCEACDPTDTTIPGAIYFNFINKTGSATVLPNSVALGYATEPGSTIVFNTPPSPLLECLPGDPRGAGYSSFAPRFSVVQGNGGDRYVNGLNAGWSGPAASGNKWWMRVAMLRFYGTGGFDSGTVILTITQPAGYGGYPGDDPPTGYNPGSGAVVVSQEVDCNILVDPVTFTGFTTLDNSSVPGTFDLVVSR